MSENNWFFRSEANWEQKDKKDDKKDNKKRPPFEKTKLTFIGEAPPFHELANDFKQASINLAERMAEVADEGHPTEGGFTEQGIRVRHGIFGVSDFLCDGCCLR